MPFPTPQGRGQRPQPGQIPGRAPGRAETHRPPALTPAQQQFEHLLADVDRELEEGDRKWAEQYRADHPETGGDSWVTL